MDEDEIADLLDDAFHDEADVRISRDFAKRLRLTKGLSQEDAAGYFGVSQATISAIEKGERPDHVYENYLMCLGTSPNSHKRTPGGDERVGRPIKKRKTTNKGAHRRR